ncbi:ATP synthase F1 subunit delta [Flavobacteriaceae bacterium]|jgi:F-type H+-transporting ATPase subunit delta|nr:ATP synthase F1 subunit delta [Flavobacteriaceae bacterium]MDB9712078.1 ATP synthase F1 subunit delta [Flavobacteriaceae bacterium]MDC1492184.1 ATP synthase F1 subunit delta [Flavobacteriaceae bacterium]MDC1534962.1 ATP synthase F1 subunit delta [Flavobacteriaceae bacterium]
MKGSRAAIRYAKAIFSLANDINMSTNVYDDMLLYINLSSNEKSFSEMLANSVIDTKSKQEIILSLNKNMSELSKDLIALLISNKRLSILVDVSNAYKSLYEKANNMTKAVVITAVPITDSIKEKALQKINSISSKKVEINNVIDKNILGGFILRYDGKEYNASLSNKLQKIKKELI